MKLPHHGRYPFSALPTRRTYTWPNGASLAVHIVVNIEQFAYRAGLGMDNTGQNGIQNQRNFGWRDYGNRVGIWNLLEMFDELDIPAAHNFNSTLFEACPEIAPAVMARGDEFVGHGRTNAERQDVLWEHDEERLIVESWDAILKHTGKAPEGWMGPYLAETPVTLDLLKQAGFRYVMDWPADDQPFWMRTVAGPILSIPYSVEINDTPVMVARQQSATDFERMIIDQFDEMLEQSRKRPLVCSIILHPFVTGVPFRLRALRRALRHVLSHREQIWLTRPGELARYVETLPAGTIPACE